jgi:uncharacterized protein (TIGR02217 family)
MSYNAAFAVKTYADIATLQTFFHAVRGREQSFLLKDWADFKVTDWTAFAEVIDGSRTTFQLIKKYVHAVIGTYTRTITKPKQIEGVGGVQIRDNGVAVSTSNYSFSSSTGIVTFSSPPTSGHTIDFKIDEFYVPVRFDIDELPVQLLNFWVDSGSDIGLAEIANIPLVEVRGE